MRMRSQLLLPGAQGKSVAKAAASACTLQAQDVGATLLSLRARVPGITAEEARRQAARKAVCRSWLMRNTIFLFASSELAWMRPLLAERPLALASRRLGEIGVPEAKLERALDHLAERLAEGPLLRKDANEAIRSLGIESSDNGSARYWVIHAAALRGVLAVRPALDRRQYLVAAPADAPLGREKGLGRLARRYLRAHGPATPDDFARFFKGTKREALTAWENAGPTVEVETERGPMTALAGSADPPSTDGPVVRLLGVWDHFLLGWQDRSLVVPAEREKLDRMASGWATAFADGRAFATWGIKRGKDALTVELEPFDRLPKGIGAALEAEVADLGRFLEVEARLRVAR
jgi:hypothetical protein